ILERSPVARPDGSVDRGSQVHESELADLHLVPSRQRGGVDPLAVDIRTVQRSDIMHRVSAAFTAKLGMPARHGDIVQKDVAVRMTASADDVLIEQEAA